MSIQFVRELPSLDLATHIASLGFVQPVTRVLREDVQNHLSCGQIVYSIEDLSVGKTIGFALFNELRNLFSVFDWPVLYLNGIILDPHYQGQGIAALAIKQAQQETHAIHLALRTQSLRMWSVGEKLTTDWTPRASLSTPAALWEVGQRAAKTVGCDFPVTQGFYGAPLYGAKPTHHNTRLQAWWDSLCNFERGDAVFCIGIFPQPN